MPFNTHTEIHYSPTEQPTNLDEVVILSKKFNVLITGFNKVTRNGKDELWITEMNGASRKVAEGDNAIELENYLLDLVWNNFPSVIVDELVLALLNMANKYKITKHTEEVEVNSSTFLYY